MTVGERIYHCRTKKHMTQKQLSEKTGIDPSTIRKYESGRLNPKIETLRKIAEALEINIGELYGINEAKCNPQQLSRLSDKISIVAKKYGKTEEEIVDWINECLSLSDEFDMSEATANRLDFLSKDTAKIIFEKVNSLDASEQLEVGELVDSFEKFNKESRKYVLEVVGRMLMLNDSGLKEALKRISELTMLQDYGKFIGGLQRMKDDGSSKK